MADTFTLITSTSVGVAGASYIEFTNLPTHFDDLVIKLVGRINGLGQGTAYSIKINGSSGLYSGTRVGGDSATARYYSSSYAQGFAGSFNGNTDTANQFSVHELHFPKYNSNKYKTFLCNYATEANIVSRCYLGADGNIWNVSDPITSIRLWGSTGDFVQYTNAYLYGIRNV